MHSAHSAQSPTEIGHADIDTNDPLAVVEHIRFLVKHEHSFPRYQELLKALVHRSSGDSSRDWAPYEEFLSLLRLYRAALEVGSVHAASFKQKVAEFDVKAGPAKL